MTKILLTIYFDLEAKKVRTQAEWPESTFAGVGTAEKIYSGVSLGSKSFQNTVDEAGSGDSLNSPLPGQFRNVVPGVALWTHIASLNLLGRILLSASEKLTQVL